MPFAKQPFWLLLIRLFCFCTFISSILFLALRNEIQHVAVSSATPGANSLFCTMTWASSSHITLRWLSNWRGRMTGSTSSKVCDRQGEKRNSKKKKERIWENNRGETERNVTRFYAATIERWKSGTQHPRAEEESRFFTRNACRPNSPHLGRAVLGVYFSFWSVVRLESVVANRFGSIVNMKVSFLSLWAVSWPLLCGWRLLVSAVVKRRTARNPLKFYRY